MWSRKVHIMSMQNVVGDLLCISRMLHHLNYITQWLKMLCKVYYHNLYINCSILLHQTRHRIVGRV